MKAFTGFFKFFIVWQISFTSLIFSQVSENELKAVFLERFTRFIDWPDDILSEEDEKFRIGIWGEVEFYDELLEVSTLRKIRGKEIELINYQKNPDSINCHMLLIGDCTKTQLKALLRKIRLLPILTVSDSDGFAEAGVQINFFTEENRLKFEVNPASIEAAGLKVNFRLLQFAKVIQGSG